MQQQQEALAPAEPDRDANHPVACRVDGQDYVRIEVNGKSVLVPPVCPHRGAPMSEGYVVGEFLVCVRHGATFDLRTGGWVRGPKCDAIAIRPAGD
jgi:nitrite reductase/ring-hydroxylating ferredoxin subunit